ncbi:flagellar transcriptional activator FlhC [Delftia sp. Cs1-4]|uniref:FlhC family transcriptional regulator n=1 Tax=Delftia sp. (strain Cs1-4) TaxID=742013 RepID=UPI00020E7A7B|nr:FlhC family transcriptional regulator [Delftia sp. Cs1-4]AEF88735.1 flagellar transcriptional activator FlhC [Delftia sp. Cs1-4]
MASPPASPATLTRHSERQLDRLALVRECAELGARMRTIEILTGLGQRQILRLLHADRCVPPRGRPPHTPEWYYGATLLERTEASVLASVYRRLRNLDVDPIRSLLAAYRHYCSVCRHAPRLSFDRAFDLARHLDGIWNAREVLLSLSTCAACGSQYLVEPGAAERSRPDCPFCKLMERYPRDPRVQMSFPTPPLPDPACLQWSLALRARRHGSAG